SEIRKRAIESALKLLKAEAGSIIFVDQDTGELYFDTAIGDKGEDVKRIRFKKGQGIAGWVVINKIEGDFFVEDMEMLIALSNQVAIAVENAQLYDELRETFYSTIHTLADTIEKRDLTTAGHTKRVTKYSVAIGKQMNLSSKELINLKLSALLHDIGKIALSDEILNKQKNFNYHEKNIVKMHPIYGAEILSHINNLKDIVPSVKYHHERHNGTGYPEGLQGDEIPLFARIIAVADSFDLLSCNREFTKLEALKQIQNKIWIEYDGEVVNAFVRAFKIMQKSEEEI
ncbi:MAG TPA: HD domain-containing protein, partial [Nitrospirae bacterium]|nr:HD domain-containing protein [Nitrospirota bacterium]